MNYPDTQFIRALGMILIINSHMDRYYPISYLGTGGAIGNAIFFSLSAFGLYLSYQKSRKEFSEWLKGRISRIYPSIWIALIFLRLPLALILGQVTADYIITFIGLFFNPPHWFLRALLVYYVLSFVLLKSERRSTLWGVLGVLGILYFVCYLTCVDMSQWSIENPPFKLIHYFMIFLFGIYLASKNESIAYTGLHNYLAIVLLLAITYGHKFLMTKGLYPEFQFIQQAAMYPMVYYLLKISRSPLISSWLMRSRAISASVQFIADHSLELYIVQETIHHPVLQLNLAFPLNAVVFIALTFILSAIINKMAAMFRTRIG